MSPEDTDPADDEEEGVDDGGSVADDLGGEEFDDLAAFDDTEGSPKAKAKAARERLEAEADRAVEGFDENVVDLLAWVLDTETRARISVYLRQNPGSTSEEVADGTGLYPSTVREALAELHGEGKVTRGKRESAGAGNNPYEYEAIAPSELVNGVVDQIQRQLNTVFNLDRRLGGADESDDESPVTITVEEESRE